MGTGRHGFHWKVYNSIFNVNIWIFVIKITIAATLNAPFRCNIDMNLYFPLQLYEAFPTVMRFLPGPHNEIFTQYKELITFVRGELEKHKEDWDPSVPRDYIDSFLAEIERVIIVFFPVALMIVFISIMGYICEHRHVPALLVYS